MLKIIPLIGFLWLEINKRIKLYKPIYYTANLVLVYLVLRYFLTKLIADLAWGINTQVAPLKFFHYFLHLYEKGREYLI